MIKEKAIRVLEAEGYNNIVFDDYMYDIDPERIIAYNFNCKKDNNENRLVSVEVVEDIFTVWELLDGATNLWTSANEYYVNGEPIPCGA